MLDAYNAHEVRCLPTPPVFQLQEQWRWWLDTWFVKDVIISHSSICSSQMRRRQKEGKRESEHLFLNQAEATWNQLNQVHQLSSAGRSSFHERCDSKPVCSLFFNIFFTYLFVPGLTESSAVSHDGEAKMPGPFLKSVKSNCQRLAE